MNIKILGSGCKKCLALADNTKAAAETAGIDPQIDKVTDVVAIAGYGLMSTPGLVIDEKLVASGRVLKAVEIGKLLAKA
ncbi:MAG: thioredoxin family protein [Marinosulfonomonas sp.]|nr:thioredoxin family protein [Marinosulfonomonas sp.]